ncbi:hypothetical protein ACHAWF_017396 [Thalassiosira exigua]
MQPTPPSRLPRSGSGAARGPPYARRSIPFSRLRTPTTDVVLALDRRGDYVIGIGSCGVGLEEDPGGRGGASRLAVKFYAVPSPERLRRAEAGEGEHAGQRRSRESKLEVSPVVRAVPLLLDDRRGRDDEDRDFDGATRRERSSPAATTPVRILLSRDGSLGVAFFLHSDAAAAAEEDVLGTIVAFEPPGHRCAAGPSARRTKSLRCASVRVGGWDSFALRNSLWPTSFVPVQGPAGRLELRRASSAYVLLNDEDDGFRIAWLTTDEAFNDDDDDDGVRFDPPTAPPDAVRPTRNDIVVETEGDAWETCASHAESGRVLDDRAGRFRGPDIAHEAYLRIDALLLDILSRRRRSSPFERSPYRNERVSFLPDFYYGLVHASPDDTTLLVVVVFSNRETRIGSSQRVPPALGVYVEVNLSDGSYRELEWVQHPSCHDAPSLKRWRDALGLDRRTKERRAGMFGPGRPVGLTREDIDKDLGDDVDIGIRGARRRGAPKDATTAASLYPQCDTISNRRVRDAIPVERIASRESPVELVYG